MCNDSFSEKDININLNQAIYILGLQLVIGSILIVSLCNLFPFEFAFEGSLSISYFASVLINFDYNLSWLSFVETFGNGVLFLLFGFGFTCFLKCRSLNRAIIYLSVLVVALIFSFSLEILQTFLPERNPSITDVLISIIGAGAGAWVFNRCGFRIMSRSLKWAENLSPSSVRRFNLLLIGYLFFIFIVIIYRPGVSDLSNWDVGFHLILGNERTGDRPWEGYISDITVSNKFLTKEEISEIFSDKQSLNETIRNDIVASYKLMGQDDFIDETGHLPSLIWRGTPQDLSANKVPLINENQWLETASPAVFLSDQIRKTSQFTLDTTISSNNSHQSGPARIISLSENIHERNFTLGQDKSNLIFRFRTPINGDNGARYELVFPYIFSDQNFHHIIITYTGSILWAYVDSLDHVQIVKMPISLNRYQILDYIFICIPLGILLLTVSYSIRRTLAFYTILFPTIALLPCLLLEVILANKYARNIEFENLVLSCLITLGTFYVIRSGNPWKGRIIRIK